MLQNIERNINFYVYIFFLFKYHIIIMNPNPHPASTYHPFIMEIALDLHRIKLRW